MLMHMTTSVPHHATKLIGSQEVCCSFEWFMLEKFCLQISYSVTPNQLMGGKNTEGVKIIY